MSLLLPSLAAQSASEGGLRSLRVTSEAYSRDLDFIATLASHKNKKEPRPEHGSLASLASSSSSFKLATGLGHNPPVKPTTRRQLDPIQARKAGDELAAKRRVYKLREQLSHSRSVAATMQRRANNAIIGEEVRNETRRLQGAHLHNSVNKVPPATEEEVSKVATVLMKKLAVTEPDAGNRGWFKLFKSFDENGDGHISFEELMDMVRKKIKLGPQALPDSAIQAVWHSIDLDGNGWIDAGEFGRFFRQGEMPMKETRRQKQHEQRSKAAERRKPEYREPTLAEVNIEASIRNKARLDLEEVELQRALKRTSASLSSLQHSASVRSLPPLR